MATALFKPTVIFNFLLLKDNLIRDLIIKMQMVTQIQDSMQFGGWVTI
jgi:hypothetical protein